jgi:hypothetical protein
MLDDPPTRDARAARLTPPTRANPDENTNPRENEAGAKPSRGPLSAPYGRRSPDAASGALAHGAFLSDLSRRSADKQALRRISPEPLQIVELPGLLVKNMNDDIVVVKQNPARLTGAFSVQHAHLC